MVYLLLCPGYAENKLLRESGGLQGEEPIHAYTMDKNLEVDPTNKSILC